MAKNAIVVVEAFAVNCPTCNEGIKNLQDSYMFTLEEMPNEGELLQCPRCGEYCKLPRSFYKG